MNKHYVISRYYNFPPYLAKGIILLPSEFDETIHRPKSNNDYDQYIDDFASREDAEEYISSVAFDGQLTLAELMEE